MLRHTVNFDMAPPECAGLPRRSFRLDGTQWTVCEHPDADRGPALVFYAPGVARRVTRYPQNWRDIPIEALYAVSWQK
jgi:hypothetical protein